MYNKRSLSKDTKASKAPKSISKPRDIITDPMGQWKHPGKNTRIPSSDITMKGVPYPVLGVGSNGQEQMMYPGQEYTFPGADYVDEFPQMRKGGGLKSKKFSRDLEATNYLFHESPLFKKKKSKKKKIFHPKAKYYQEGGMTTQEEIDAANNAMMKARLAYANMHGNTAAQRMIVAPDEPYQYTGNEYDQLWGQPVGAEPGMIGTHYMSSFGNYAVPFIQQGSNGLYFNEAPSVEDSEAIRFDNEDDAQYFGEHYKDIAPDASYRGEYQEGGANLTPEEEAIFQKFYNTLPDNLMSDDPTYNMRGYWDSEGRPEAFDYSQPTEDDGYYHAYSINGNTGEYLKSPAHETFQHAVDEDRKMGYRPITDVYGRNIVTENESIAAPAPTHFLNDTTGPANYIDLELTPEEIQQYRDGGYIVEELPKAQTGKTFSMDQGEYGDTYYVHPDRPGSIYFKENGKWLIKNSSTDFHFVPIKDPKGERAKNLNKNAVKATQFELDRWSNSSPYDRFSQRTHIANVAGGMDPKKSEKQIKTALENEIFNNTFSTKDQTWMHPRDASNAIELYNKGLDFHKGWMNSPMYKKMLANSINAGKASGVDESQMAQQRIQNFSTIPSMIFPKQPEDKSTTGGMSMNANGLVKIFPYGAGVSDLSAHEISHSVDRPDYTTSENRLIPQADINYIQNATPALINTPKWKSYDADLQQQLLNDPEHLQEEKDWINYVAEPTEVRARLNAIRAVAKESGTYDPYTQEVTPEIYDMLQKMSFGTDEKEGFNPIQQLKDIYSDEQIMEMLNTISKNDNSAGDQLNMAKKGGSLLTKKVTCKKCGWKWDAADGGSDITTCHKCGGKGLVHAKTGGITVGQEIDLTPEQEAHLRKLGYKLERIK